MDDRIPIFLARLRAALGTTGCAHCAHLVRLSDKEFVFETVGICGCRRRDLNDYGEVIWDSLRAAKLWPSKPETYEVLRFAFALLQEDD